MKNKRALFKLFLATASVLAIFGLTSCSKSFINEHAIAEKFDHIQITTDTADVNVIPTDGECRVVCNELKKLTHGVTVENGVLKIQVSDTRSRLGKLFTPETSVTVYLPTADYTTLAIEVDTGDVSVSKITCTSSVSAKIDTGDVELENVKASEIAVGTDTGEIGDRTPYRRLRPCQPALFQHEFQPFRSCRNIPFIGNILSRRS